MSQWKELWVEVHKLPFWLKFKFTPRQRCQLVGRITHDIWYNSKDVYQKYLMHIDQAESHFQKQKMQSTFIRKTSARNFLGPPWKIMILYIYHKDKEWMLLGAALSSHFNKLYLARLLVYLISNQKHYNTNFCCRYITSQFDFGSSYYS